MIRAAQIVYDCIPNAGSDPGIGWHSVVCASKAGFEVHAFTKASNQAGIESVAPLRNVTWHFVDAPSVPWPLKPGRSLGDTVHLARWLLEAEPILAGLARNDQIDLTHFVTFTAHWMPVPLSNIDLPHVFGPVGGGEQSPPPLLDKTVDRVSALSRDAFQGSLTRTRTWNRLLKSRRTLVISGSSATTERLQDRGVDVYETWRTGCLPETLIAQMDEVVPEQFDTTTIVMSGRQLRWKGHDIAIDSMPLVLERLDDAQLLILGEGPEHNNLRRKVAEAGLSNDVIFRGKVDRDEERRLIAGADCFLFPSRRDTGSTLVPLVQVMGVPIAAFATGALPEATGGFASLAEPGGDSSPSASLADAIVDAVNTPAQKLDEARSHAIDRFGEESAIAALQRWYAAALDQ